MSERMTRSLQEATHVVIRPTQQFPAAKLGKFNGALFPLGRFDSEVSRVGMPLASIMLVIDGVGYRAHPTTVVENVADARSDWSSMWAQVYEVSPIPVQVET
jgi:hypothetical protein